MICTKKIVPGIVFAVFLYLSLPTHALLAAPPQSAGKSNLAKIDSKVLEEIHTKGQTTYLVELRGKADLTGVEKITDWNRRGWVVYQRLKEAAERSQQRLGSLLKGRGIAHQSFFILNAIKVTSDEATLREIAEGADVEAVRATPEYQLVETRKSPFVQGEGVLWNLQKIGADAVWGLGITGQGIVVANIDTGVDYQHVALVQQYRGNSHNGTFDHNYNWYDPFKLCGDPSLVPCDDKGHGTHTMGTMLGGDGPGPFTPDVGIAPGAQWLAAKACNSSRCPYVLEAAQWMLAPTDLNGQNPRPDLRPQIINNSYVGVADPTMQSIITAWRASGILPVFANGNAGPDCYTVGSPGAFPESIGVGATAADDSITSFSSRGPSLLGVIKPDVVAPGDSIYSSVPGGYATMSGTSMAAPHVAGSAALLWSAASGLIGNIDGTILLLRETAHPTFDNQCGDLSADKPNNVYGSGRIDVFSAVRAALAHSQLAGNVTSAANGSAIAGASVRVVGPVDRSASTDVSGKYTLYLEPGPYTVSVEAFGFASQSLSINMSQNQTLSQDFALTPSPKWFISGKVIDENGTGVFGSTVRLMGGTFPSTLTDGSGDFVISDVPEGEYDITASLGGCAQIATAHIQVTSNVNINLATPLIRDAFGYSCRIVPFEWIEAADPSGLTGLRDETAAIPLPFPLWFYGKTYGTAYVGIHGFINFLSPSLTGSYLNTPIPNVTPPNAALYPLWTRLYLGGTDSEGQVKTSTIGTPPNRRFVIEYENAWGCCAMTPDYLTFETILEEGTNHVTFQYKSINPPRGNGLYSTVGIENESGTTGLQYLYKQDLIRNGLSIEFFPPDVYLQPTSVDFGDELVGTTSASQAITLMNSGMAALSITNIAASGDFAQTNTCGSSVAAGASCTITVTFTPTSTGTRTGTVIITDSAVGSPHAVQLSGRGLAPGVTLSAATITFTDQLVGTTSASQAIMLTYIGPSDLTISSIATSGDYAQTNNCGSTVVSGASCTIVVTFTPTSTGTKTGTVTIADSAPGSPHKVQLSGRGVEPGVTLSASSLTFTDQMVGTTSASQGVILTNNGTAALTITSIAASGDFAQTNTCGSSVAAGVSCTITVTFTPMAARTRTGAITISDNAPGSPHLVLLTGTGVGPEATMSARNLTFSDQLVGTTSAFQAVTLTNSGTSVLTITSIAANGDFAQTNTCGSSVVAGASCTITVTFTPTAAGTRTGAVTITDSAAGSPHTVELSGTGVEPGLMMSTRSLTFTDQIVGTTSASQPVTLTNSATTAVTITSIAASGDYAQTNTCGTSMAAGANCTIRVTFTPTGTGTKTGAVTITDSAPGSPHTVQLTGTGVAPAVTLSVGTLSFTDQLVGTTSAAQTITLTNSGTATLTITSIATSGDFAQTNTCGSSVAAGANCTIRVTFTPTATGTRTGAVTITDSAVGSPRVVQLSGAGITVLPLVVTGAATAITSSGARLEGTVNPNGLLTTAYFEWGTSTAYGNTTAPESMGAGLTAVTASTVLSGLTANGFYHYRMVASNSAGRAEGHDRTFTAITLSFVSSGVGVGSHPYGIARGDFDGDGKMDWVAPIYYGSAVTVGLGNGDGTFRTASYGAGANPSSVAVGDFNGDGKMDVAVTNGNGVSILLGQGDGTFWDAINNGSGGADSVAVADVNGDGKLDVLVVNTGSNSVLVLLGRGDGSLAPAVSYAVGAQPSDVVVGDFNGDGKLDLGVGNSGSSSVSVLLGNGDGTFQGAVNYVAGSGAVYGMEMGDFNGDGKLDLAATLFGGSQVGILLGKGDGTFEQGGSYEAGSAPFAIASADVNGDGKEDLVLTNLDGRSVTILLGTGDGRFQEAQRFEVGFYPRGVAAADFDGDGKVDLAVVNELSGSVTVLRNSCGECGRGWPVPMVTLSASTLTFADQLVGTTSAVQTITLTNSGTATLTITSIATSGDFAQTNTCGSSVAAGANCTITVTFTPTSTGTKTEAVTITNSATGSPHLIQLTGTGVAPAVTLSAGTLSFTDQLVGTTSASQAVTLTNTGTSALAITSIAASGDFAQTNTCGSSVAAGASCTITVTFTPTGTGTKTGAVTITDSATGSPHTVQLTGTGVAPAVTLSAGTLSFTDQLVGTTSASQAVTLTNTGTSALAITSIAASGDFAQTNTCGTSVTAGASCTIIVTFTPMAAGTRMGTVTVTDSATGSPHTVQLTGTGVAPAVTLSASTLSFTDQLVGTTSAAQTITLTNSGTATLTITSIAASGDYAQTNTCGSSVAAGANCTITLTFTPTGTGTRTGAVTVTDNAAGNPHVINLKGEAIGGYEADVAPRPTGSNNGTVTLTDWVQVGRFVAGLDTASPGIEFQKADCAPKSTLGDGRITLTDWVQAGRYAAGLDPMVVAGGPTAPASKSARGYRNNEGLIPDESPRIIRLRPVVSEEEGLAMWVVEIESMGDENAISFSLAYHPTLLSFRDINLGQDNEAATINVNTQEVSNGRTGVIMALPPGQAFLRGKRTLVKVAFDKKSMLTSIPFIDFADEPNAREISDVEANQLGGKFESSPPLERFKSTR